MAKQTFTSGQTLLASQMNSLQANDYNLSVSTQTANYTLVAADKGTREVMNMASAGTVTVPNATFDAGDSVWVHSIGSGTISVVAGSGMTLNSAAGTAPTLARWEGGVVYFTSASSSIFFRGGGSNTLSVDYLVVGGGGGGGRGAGASGVGAGAGAGGFRTATDIIAKGNTYTVTVGAGGTGGSAASRAGRNGTASSFIRSANGGGASLDGESGAASGLNGGSGAGSAGDGGNAGGAGVSGEGNNGGSAGTTKTAAGGGGGAGGVGANSASGTTGANGGAASTNDYTGSTISYSGGGGAGGTTAGGTAGTNAGAGGTGNGSNATANRGGGGGGSGTGTGGNGGSGEVVIRALTADLAKFTVTTTGSPTTGTSGSYTYYQYTATGSFRID